MSFLKQFKGGYQDLWKAIIRPPRDEYTITDLGIVNNYLLNLTKD